MEIQAALCQTKPALGNLDQNLSSRIEWLKKATQEGADLVLFPELSLTGYLLRDLTQEIASLWTRTPSRNWSRTAAT